MVVNLLFYSAKDLVDFAVVFFVVAADFANERHQYSEATTDKSHHDLSIHRITFSYLLPVLVGMGLRLLWLGLQRPSRLGFLCHVATQRRSGRF
jgi:hypothetical protein